MSRRADAPQTVNADTARAAELRKAARDCILDLFHVPSACQLHRVIPSGTTPDADTVAAVEAVTGKPVDLQGPGEIPARLRAKLRRWAIRRIFTD